MIIPLEECEWCGRSCYPNQLIYSEHQGGKVCRGCVVDTGPEDRREDGPSVVLVKEEGEWGL